MFDGDRDDNVRELLLYSIVKKTRFGSYVNFLREIIFKRWHEFSISVDMWSQIGEYYLIYIYVTHLFDSENVENYVSQNRIGNIFKFSLEIIIKPH